MKVMVVDDNRDAANSLSMLVKWHGHEVRTAYDGLEALEIAGAFYPDIVLLDLGMPGMDGYEVCRKARAQPWGATTTVVAVTGWGQEEDRLKTQKAGFNLHLVKPVSPRVITDLLSVLAGKRGSSQPAAAVRQ
jgi:CheY-like chemotaxis protein